MPACKQANKQTQNTQNKQAQTNEHSNKQAQTNEHSNKQAQTSEHSNKRPQNKANTKAETHEIVAVKVQELLSQDRNIKYVKIGVVFVHVDDDSKEQTTDIS